MEKADSLHGEKLERRQNIIIMHIHFGTEKIINGKSFLQKSQEQSMMPHM